MKTKKKTVKANKVSAQELIPKLRFPEFLDARAWRVSKLGIASDFVKEKMPLDQLTLDNYVSTVNLLPEYSGVIRAPKIPRSGSVTKFKKDDILISNIRPYLKKIWFATKVGGASNDVIVVRSKMNVSKKYLSFMLMTDAFISHVMIGAKGVKMPRGDMSQMKEYLLAIPTPKEQKKIADFLASIDQLIIAQSQKLDNLKAHKKGLLQQLFPAQGETVPKLRFQEFRDAGAWVEHKLAQIATFRRGSFPQPYGLPKWYDYINGMPFIQVFDVNDDLRLKPTTKRKISKLAAEKSVFIPKGTLIVTIQGSIGRVAVTQYDAYIDRTLLIFQKFHKQTETLFFAYVIQNVFETERKIAPGGIIKTITKKVLSDFKVQLPSLLEQQKIADCLSSFEELIAAQSQKLDTLKFHKKGLVQQLFPSIDEVNT